MKNWTARATGAAWHAEQLSRYARILAVADIFDALHAKRPYRDGMPLEKVFQCCERTRRTRSICRASKR